MDPEVLFAPGAKTRRQITAKVRQLIHAHDLPVQDREEAEQELALAVIEAAHRQQTPLRSAEAFFQTVLDRRAVSLLRHRSAQKRQAGRITGTVDVDHLVDPRSDQDAQERTERHLDVEQLLPRLPTELRSLAEDLRTMTPHAAGQRPGRTRKRVAHLMRQLKHWMVRIGLGPPRE